MGREGTALAGSSTPNRCEPVVSVEPGCGDGVWFVRVLGLDRENLAARPAASTPLLRVRVAEGSDDDELPDVAGSLQVFSGEVRFVPDLPFRPGILFRAILDLRGAENGGVIASDFSVPEKEADEETRVIHVYPSPNVLPENLLRFTVRFSSPMSRGSVERHVRLIGADGSPVPDALYRAPVELWDRGMTCLTVLLDPGRLKRGVGPNRMLGAPLEAGRSYTLKIEPGMLDAHGRRLKDGFSKPFSVAEPVRAALVMESWNVRRPAAGSREPLELTFPWPLDWGQLWAGIVVTSPSGERVDGMIDVDHEETCWRFTPRSPWHEGRYQLRVSPTLEDFCGNTPSGPFDGPFRSAEDVQRETAIPSIDFVVQAVPPL